MVSTRPDLARPLGHYLFSYLLFVISIYICSRTHSFIHSSPSPFCTHIFSWSHRGIASNLVLFIARRLCRHPSISCQLIIIIAVALVFVHTTIHNSSIRIFVVAVVSLLASSLHSPSLRAFPVGYAVWIRLF